MLQYFIYISSEAIKWLENEEIFHIDGHVRIIGDYGLNFFEKFQAWSDVVDRALVTWLCIEKLS